MGFVHLWHATLARSSGDVALLQRFLDAAEIARANAFRSEGNRERFIVAHATLRCLLASYSGIPPERVTFVGSPGGKPEISGDKPDTSLRFNLSHSGDDMLCAIADRKVGVDVEKIKNSDDMDRIAFHFFSSDESRMYSEMPHTERTEFFFRTWVRKEAFVKATGGGLSRDTTSFTVQMPPSAGIVVHSSDGSRHLECSFQVYDLPDIGENFAAIALEGGGAMPELRYREWPD
jgi:4'-phosphopantetheinyl transferase